MRRLLLVVPILAVIAAGVLLETWRGGAPPPQPQAADAQALPRYKVTDGRWVRYNAQGEPEFQATAEIIEYFDDESARLKTIEMHSLGGATSPWRLSAPEGFAPPHSQQRLQLRGGVSAMAHWPQGEPLSFESPYLWIDQARRQLDTDAPVLVRGRSRSARAGGLRADWVGKSVELTEARMQYVQPDR